MKIKRFLYQGKSYFWLKLCNKFYTKIFTKLSTLEVQSKSLDVVTKQGIKGLFGYSLFCCN